MDLELVIEDARALARVLRAYADEHEDEADAERLRRIAERAERLLTTPVVQHDPFV